MNACNIWLIVSLTVELGLWSEVPAMDQHTAVNRILRLLETGSEAEKTKALWDVWEEKNRFVKLKDVPLINLLVCLDSARTTQLKRILLIHIGNRDCSSSAALRLLRAIATDSQEDIAIRNFAIHWLTSVPHEAIDCFLALVSSDSIAIRQTIAEKISFLKPEREHLPRLRLLLGALLVDSDSDVRFNTRLSLTELSKRHKSLLRIADKDPPLIVASLLAAKCIHRPEDIRVIENLSALLLDKDRRVREAGAYGLAEARRGTLPAVTNVVRALVNERSWSVRSDLCWYLAHVEAKFGALIEPVLLRRLTDDDPIVRASAAKAVGCHGFREAINRLCTMLEKDDDPMVALEALEALVRMRVRSPAVFRAIDHAVTRGMLEQLEAAQALSELRKK